MKKLLASALAAAMLLSGAASVIADGAVPLADELVLAEESHLKIADGIIDMIDGTVTVADLKANFRGGVAVTAPDGTAKADDKAVATDDVVKAGDDSAKAVIWGDVDRNGKVNLMDIGAMMKVIAGWDTQIAKNAADVDRDGDIKLNDVAKFLKHLAGWEDISLGNVRMVFENTALKADNEDDTLKLSFTNMMNKLGAHQTEHTGENSYKIKLAKNESESCTAILWSDTAKEGMTAELSDFVSEYGDAVLLSDLKWVLYQEDQTVFTQVNPWYNDRNYDSSKVDDHPEVLLDMADSFELEGEAHQQFVVTVSAGKDTPAGMYKATLTVRDADGKAVKTANVYANVWDFTLPDEPYSASLFNGGSGVEYYDFLLDQNLSSYLLPYEITDDRADAYMNDPRVTAFVISGMYENYGGIMGRTDEQIVANYNKVASNPDWFRKGMFYYTDEPYGDGLFKVRDYYNFLVELLGTDNIRNMTPFGQSFPDQDHQNRGIDSVEFIKPYINVWVPTSDAYHRMAEGGRWTPRRIEQLYGEYPDRIEEMRARGDDIWWYVCVSPEVPYANYFTCYQGVIVRLLSWQQYFNNVNGVLYYQTLGGIISKYQFDIGNGDGVLMYDGSYWGRTGPQASWRLYQVRDGFDDFDYLRIAEELVGRETVMEVVKKVSSGMLLYTEDYRVLDAARDEIAKLILKAQAEK